MSELAAECMPGAEFGNYLETYRDAYLAYLYKKEGEPLSICSNRELRLVQKILKDEIVIDYDDLKAEIPYEGETTMLERIHRAHEEILAFTGGNTDEAEKNYPRTRRKGSGDKSWKAEGNCQGVDPELFYPDRGASTEEAKAVCATCVVKVPCLEYALKNYEIGIWGGTSDRERRRIVKQRTAAKQQEAAEQDKEPPIFEEAI